MDWLELLHRPDRATVITSAGISAVAATITATFAWASLKRTYRLEDRTETLLRKLLGDRRFKGRSRKFSTLQHHVPLTDEKLREALLRAGAIRFENREGEEMWGLIGYHSDKVAPKPTPKS